MTREEQEIDDIDRRLFALMNRCPQASKYFGLWKAIFRARSIAHSLLPENRKRELDGEKAPLK